jgi:hypothetical protein
MEDNGKTEEHKRKYTRPLSALEGQDSDSDSDSDNDAEDSEDERKKELEE